MWTVGSDQDSLPHTRRLWRYDSKARDSQGLLRQRPLCVSVNPPDHLRRQPSFLVRIPLLQLLHPFARNLIQNREKPLDRKRDQPLNVIIFARARSLDAGSRSTLTCPEIRVRLRTSFRHKSRLGISSSRIISWSLAEASPCVNDARR